MTVRCLGVNFDCRLTKRINNASNIKSNKKPSVLYIRVLNRPSYLNI